MYELMVEEQFAAAHQLREYQGKCENLHGHNWKVQVFVQADNLNKIGLAVDFNDIKQALRTLLAQLDHQFLNQLPDFQQLNPSSENIACWLFNKLKNDPQLKDVRLSKTVVWESDIACAAYWE